MFFSQGIQELLPHGSALGVDFALVLIYAALGVTIQINQDGQTMAPGPDLTHHLLL